MKMKFLALVCAVTMVMGASLTAAAAGSNSATNVASSPEVTYDVGSGSQQISTWNRENWPAQTKVEGGTVTAVDAGTFQDAVNQANALYGKDTFIASIVDINVPNATFPYELTIHNDNVWAGQNVTVLHKGANGWETLAPSKVVDNAITVTVNSFSPFALVIDTGHSPKTMDIALMVGGLAGLFAAGTALTGKKKED